MIVGDLTDDIKKQMVKEIKQFIFKLQEGTEKI